MDYNEAVKATGGDSCGGQLIVRHEGQNVLVGRHNHDGQLIVEDSDVARAIIAGLDANKPAVETTKGRRKKDAAIHVPPEHDEAQVEEPVHHDVVVEDEVVTEEHIG
jgi:hypothetical protein